MAEQEQQPHCTPPLPPEIVAEILLRLPPREPACLLRASLVCKFWGRAVSHPRFRRRFHERHGAPPVLGFLHNWEDEQNPRFIRTTASPFSLAAPDCRFWRALDCRHGRALFLSKGQDANERLLLRDLLTGSEQYVPVPVAFEKMSPTAAVFCAADGCDHSGCHGGPFHLFFVFSVKVHTDDEAYVTSACVYSSETSTWGAPTSLQDVFSMKFTRYSSVLVARSHLYFMSDNVLILEYDLAKHSLAVLDPPDDKPGYAYAGRFNIMLAKDGGGLGVCQYLDPNLKLWTREASDAADARWVLSRVINLGNLLPTGSLLDVNSRVQVLGFAEGANVMFFSTVAGIFTVELQSVEARKVCDKRGFCNLIPVVSFYTPAPRGEYGDSSSSSGSSEEGEEEEQTVDQAQPLFDKGSDAIKEARLVNECDIKIRDPYFGEVAPECASMEDKHGHAIPSEAQEVTNPLGDVPNNALNEELVKSTSTGSKDDAGNSKTSGSNIENDAPTSEKGDSEEVLLC